VYTLKGSSSSVTLECTGNKLWAIKAPISSVSGSAMNTVAKCCLSGVDAILPSQSCRAEWKFVQAVNTFQPCEELVVTVPTGNLLPPEVLSLLTATNQSVSDSNNVGLSVSLYLCLFLYQCLLFELNG
jgi:hypothetical protein